MDTFGFITIAIGDISQIENKKCISSIRKMFGKNTNIVTITEDASIQASYMVTSRLIKTDLIKYIPSDWSYCIYVDSDTRVISKSITNIISILEDGYDLVICPSNSQDFWHINDVEREYTYDYVGYQPLQLQGGMFGFNNNTTMHNFFSAFHETYKQFQDQDQAALVRTIHDVPVKYWLLGYPFNSSNGAVVQHLFGATRKSNQ